MQTIPPDYDDEDDLRLFWANYWDSNPCSYPDRSGDLRSVTKTSDFYSAQPWHSTGMYTDFFGPYGMPAAGLPCRPFMPSNWA